MVNPEHCRRDVVVIAASAGGVETLIDLFSCMEAVTESRIAVVLHRSPTHKSRLARVLGQRSPLPVVEPAQGTVWRPGRIYVAPRDRHMVVDATGALRLTRGAKEHHTRPAADPLFESVARVFGPRVIGVVLTGTGDDGVRGLLSIRATGGVALVQHPAEAVHPAMPRNALARDHVDAALTVAEIATALAEMAKGNAVEAPVPTAA
jgi:two-component system, chemotaxis family, protein-glutamate methylesterase/glutaminase